MPLTATNWADKFSYGVLLIKPNKYQHLAIISNYWHFISNYLLLSINCGPYFSFYDSGGHATIKVKFYLLTFETRKIYFVDAAMFAKNLSFIFIIIVQRILYFA